MILTPIITTDAEWDIAYITAYFNERDETITERFYHALNKTIDFLCAVPGSGERFPLDPSGLIRRRAVTGKFRRYMIYYRRIDETLQILRVVHGARDDAKLFEE
jgi:toxin ParE1/3/4